MTTRSTPPAGVSGTALVAARRGGVVFFRLGLVAVLVAVLVGTLVGPVGAGGGEVGGVGGRGAGGALRPQRPRRSSSSRPLDMLPDRLRDSAQLARGASDPEPGLRREHQRGTKLPPRPPGVKAHRWADGHAGKGGEEPP